MVIIYNYTSDARISEHQVYITLLCVFSFEYIFFKPQGKESVKKLEKNKEHFQILTNEGKTKINKLR